MPANQRRTGENKNVAEEESAILLSNAISSVAAVWVMIAAQFGVHGIVEFNDLRRYFYLEHVPLWRYSDVYYDPDGISSGAAPQNYPF